MSRRYRPCCPTSACDSCLSTCCCSCCFHGSPMPLTRSRPAAPLQSAMLCVQSHFLTISSYARAVSNPRRKQMLCQSLSRSSRGPPAEFTLAVMDRETRLTKQLHQTRAQLKSASEANRQDRG